MTMAARKDRRIERVAFLGEDVEGGDVILAKPSNRRVGYATASA
jgi:hypothetical protein